MVKEIIKRNLSPYVVSVSPYDVITENTTVRIRANKISIQNLSNYKVTLFRTWTLVPGQSFVMGSEENNEKMIADMPITFDTVLFDNAGPDIKRVEILLMHRIGPDHAFTSTPSQTESKPLYQD
jgi:hypothetical protein